MTCGPTYCNTPFARVNRIDFEPIIRFPFELGFDGHLPLHDFFQTDWNRAWLEAVDLDALRQRDLRLVSQSQNSFARALVADVHGCDEIERAQIVQFISTARQHDVDRSWWIVTDLERLRADEVELDVDVCGHGLILAGH